MFTQQDFCFFLSPCFLPPNHLSSIIEQRYNFSMWHWLKNFPRYHHCYKTKEKILHRINSRWTQTPEIPSINQGALVCLQPCIAPFKQANLQAPKAPGHATSEQDTQRIWSRHLTLPHALLSDAHLSQLQFGLPSILLPCSSEWALYTAS